MTELETSFQQQPRESLQPLYVITPYDQGRSVFTRPSPTRPVLNRVKQLAKATLDLATARVNNLDLFDVKDLFKPNLSGYNLLIHLRPLLNPKRHEQVEGIGDSKIVLEAYQHHPKEKIPITGWDPVESYLRTLWVSLGNFETLESDFVVLLFRSNMESLLVFSMTVLGGMLWGCYGILSHEMSKTLR